MQKLVSVKSKRNPWAAPMWLVEHLFWAFQLGLLTLSLVFLALALLLDWMLFFAFLTWVFMGICLLGGVINFFYEGGGSISSVGSAPSTITTERLKTDLTCPSLGCRIEA